MQPTDAGKPVTIVRLASEKAMAYTPDTDAHQHVLAGAAVSVWLGAMTLKRHIVLSLLPDTSQFPSAENARAFTLSVWCCSVKSSTRVPTMFHNLTVVSSDPEAIMVPSSIPREGGRGMQRNGHEINRF